MSLKIYSIPFTIQSIFNTDVSGDAKILINNRCCRIPRKPRFNPVSVVTINNILGNDQSLAPAGIDAMRTGCWISLII